MRRNHTTPSMDMIPMMGLCAVLIPLVLMAQTPPVATIQTSLPGF